jgi:DNA-binding NtrC family response regulator
MSNTPSIFGKRKLTATTGPSYPRYLIGESPAGRAFVSDLKKCATESTSIFLVGQDEAEFELAAREVNYFANRDCAPLEIVTGDDLSIDYLQAVERQANAIKQPMLAYVGRVDDWNERAIRELVLFVEYLKNLRNPHLRLIMAYQQGSDEFFQIGVADYVKKLRKQVQSVQVPSLAERAEDIAPLCQILIGSMRAAHPFLLVGRISREAIDALVEDRANYSYAKLVRILRNSIALCQRTTLQIEDIKNYGESDLTTQHLLESMADEQYFPSQVVIS